MAFRKLFVAALASLPMATLAQTAPAAEPAPAAAPAAPPAAPVVQVYGTLNVNLQYTQAKDATAGSAADIAGRWAIGTDSTNIGVRGTLDVGKGYKVVYQCETQANLDGEDTRAICNRNSRVGLSSFWGTLFYGNWDTPFKAAHYGTKADDPFGNTDVFGFQAIMGSPGYNTRSSAFNASAAAAYTASFDQRAANSVAYWSPKFSGLELRAQYSVDELSDTAGIVRPQLFSANALYNQGPLSVVAATEFHMDAFGLGKIAGTAQNALGGQPETDWAWRLAAGFDLPVALGTLNLMAMVEQLNYGQSDAAAAALYKDYSRFAWLAGAKLRMGSHEFRARYSQALGPSITAATGAAAPNEDDLGAQEYTLGYAYHMAKSTQLFLFYTQIMNQDRARYVFGLGGAAALASVPAGADPMAVGAGIRVAFP